MNGYLMRCRVGLVMMISLLVLNAAAQQLAGATSAPPPLSAEATSQIINVMYSRFDVPHDADIAIGAPAISEFTGYDRIPITVHIGQQTHKVDFLVSRDRRTLIRYSTVDLSDDNPMRNVEISQSLGWGNPEAPVQIVAFMDLQCPYCAAMHRQFIGATLQHYKGELWITYKPFPLDSHDKAMAFAKQAECIGQQSADAYKIYVSSLYAPTSEDSGDVDALAERVVRENHLNSERMNRCVEDPNTVIAVQRAVQDGVDAGVSATPTFFVNGEKVRGGLTQAALWKVIDRAEQNYQREHGKRISANLKSPIPGPSR